MPLIVGQQITPTTIAAAVPKTGMPWEVWLIVAAVVVPFLLAIGGAVGVALWARGKMKLDRYLKIFSNGDVHLGDLKPEKGTINLDDEKHILAKGKPKLFLRSRFGWRQPLHFLEQGQSLEKDFSSSKFAKGTDLENSNYLKAYVDSERAKQIFTLSTNVGFSIVLGIACAAVGVIIGLAFAHFTANSGGVVSATNITTTTITGMIKK
jgi:hypothetical protein